MKRKVRVCLSIHIKLKGIVLAHTRSVTGVVGRQVVDVCRSERSGYREPSKKVSLLTNEDSGLVAGVSARERCQRSGLAVSTTDDLSKSLLARSGVVQGMQTRTLI